MKAFVTALLVLAVMAAGCGSSSSNSSSGGVVHITMWHGFVDIEGATMKSMVAQFNASHPDIQVKVQYAGNTDYALQKVRDRDRERRSTRHLLPVRVVGRQHRPEPQGASI